MNGNFFKTVMSVPGSSGYPHMQIINPHDSGYEIWIWGFLLSNKGSPAWWTIRGSMTPVNSSEHTDHCNSIFGNPTHPIAKTYKGELSSPQGGMHDDLRIPADSVFHLKHENPDYPYVILSPGTGCVAVCHSGVTAVAVPHWEQRAIQ